MSQDKRFALSDVTNQVGDGKRGLFSDDNSSFHSGKKQCVEKGYYFTKQITGEAVLRPHSGENGVCVKDGMSAADGGCVVVDVEDEDDDEKTTGFVVVMENVSNLGVNEEDNDVSMGNLESSKDEYLDFSRFPESQESICGLERFIWQKGGDGSSSMSVDLIKSCPCSFCTKAAYLWTDLHYQDMKGRIAVVKKSQKEASILVYRNSRNAATGRHGQGNVGNYSNLESDLTGRWKSLFLHMEDIFVRESNQLETNLSRDDWKTDLEKQ